MRSGRGAGAGGPGRFASAVGAFGFQQLAKGWVANAPGNVVLLNAAVTAVGVAVAVVVDRGEKRRLAEGPAA